MTPANNPINLIAKKHQIKSAYCSNKTTILMTYLCYFIIINHKF